MAKPATSAVPTTLAEWLKWGSKVLASAQSPNEPPSDSPQLDARLLLAHVLQVSSSYLYTWPEKTLNPQQIGQYQQLIAARHQGQPVAYLLGEREFWDLKLAVSPDTLIPRPETEVLVEAALQLDLPADARVLDLGTGTGAIALALASERPQWQITGVDRIAEAVELAKTNAQANQLVVTFLQSHWFSQVSGCFDLIVSNPPYVESDSPCLQQGDVRFEPLSALTAGQDGLDDIRHIIQQAPDYLRTGGVLMFEHGFKQGSAVSQLLREQGFEHTNSLPDLAGKSRITLGGGLRER